MGQSSNVKDNISVALVFDNNCPLSTIEHAVQIYCDVLALTASARELRTICAVVNL